MAIRPAFAVPTLVARAPELDAARRFIEAAFADRRPRAVDVSGPAGIGKTWLWQATVGAADGAGVRVLRAAPSRTEQDLGYAALGDLLASVSDEVVDRLPPPQRNGLRVATLRQEPGTSAPDARTTAMALVGVLRAIAEHGPVLVAIDDAQWLDAPSRTVLGFALRRLDDLPVALLVARRIEDSADAGEPLALTFGPDQVLALSVEPLSTGALFQVLRERLGHAFARPTIVRIAEWSGGNPLLAIELGRAALRSGGFVGRTASADLPRTVTAAVDARLVALSPDEGRTVLLTACAVDQTETTLSRAASILGWPLVEPRDTEVLRRDGLRLRLGHPLVAAQAVARARPDELRAVHRALAQVMADPVARARHLAIGAGPGEELADALDIAAQAASARGAIETAIDLAALACDATPAHDKAHAASRRRRLGELLLRAGEWTQAGEVLRAAVAAAAAGPERALAKIALATVAGNEDGPTAATQLCREATTESRGSRLIRGQAELAWSRWSDDATEGLRHARRAAELLVDGPTDARARAMANLVASISQVGDPVPQDLLEEAFRLEVAAPLPRLLEGPAATQAWLSLLDDNLAAAHAQYEVLRQRADEAGDESSLGRILIDLAQIDLRWGRWLELEDHAREAISIAERTGFGRDRALAVIQLGALAASRGDRPEAERHLGAALAFARTGGHAFISAVATGNLGTLALGEGDLERAEAFLATASAELAEAGIGDMALSRFQGDRLEALIALGRLDEATVLAGQIEAMARRNGRRRPMALAARGRGLIAAAEGRHDEAIGELTRSIAELRALDMPFEAARSQLARGTVHRRGRAKRLADQDFEAAIETFVRLGARNWVDRAMAERLRVGLRPRAPRALTETESTVARLAANGLTSREIAATAFMSPRTVEGVLARVYAKLGIGSRAELGRAVAEQEPPSH